MKLLRISISEIIGTAFLVACGCGVAMATGADVVATALAFGLALMAMCYCIGHFSGCHINPAVSLAMLIKRKISFKEFCVYIVSQLVGACIGCLLLLMIFGSKSSFGANQVQPLIQTTWAESKAMQLIVGLVVEVVLTFAFVLTVCGVVNRDKYSAVSGVVIGLALTLVHLFGIPLTGTSVNPARSLVPAIFAVGYSTTPITQVWIFIVGPLIGGALAAVVHNALEKCHKECEVCAKDLTETVPLVEPTTTTTTATVTTVKTTSTEPAKAAKKPAAKKPAAKPAAKKPAEKTKTTTKRISKVK